MTFHWFPCLHERQIPGGRRHGKAMARHSRRRRIGSGTSTAAAPKEPKRKTKRRGLPAPPCHAFMTVLDSAVRGIAPSVQGIAGVGRGGKVRRMEYCLAEARRVHIRAQLRKACSISLQRDARQARLAVHFTAVDPALNTYRGLLGVQRNFGTTAWDITKATAAIFRRAAVICRGTKCAKLDKALLRHMKATVHMICVDSANDELLSAEIMRQPIREAMGVLTPNLRVVLRDAAHASRRTHQFSLSLSLLCCLCFVLVVKVKTPNITNSS